MVDLRGQQVTLPAHMAFELASSWHDQLVPWLEHEVIEVDGAQVQDIDVAAFEALAAFFMGRRHRRLITRWSTLSPSLRERIESLGLSSVLLLPAAG